MGATTLTLLIATPAMACDGTCPHMMDKKPEIAKAHQGHGTHTSMAKKGADNAPTKAYKSGMNAMHKDMEITYTGDADIDFLKGMIPHHQGAVDMAQIQLQYGKDAQVKRMARDVIRAQNAEIRWMKDRLQQLESRGAEKTDKPTGPARWNDEKWLGNVNFYQ
ncbi:MAG: DUF305 domain-containing protein [Alphaproteobacteria bacterium CG_4_10_14_0_8_um_filter_53_9]|nr:MAG: DUF305 domain-containing protein [Alphaproteobacteria bacterium CG_4_10_14_0_8_um_filter_53_9]